MKKFLLPFLFSACSPYLYSFNPQYPISDRVVSISTKVVVNQEDFGLPIFAEGSCNGLLFDAQKILTAAHCISDALWIGVNDTDRNGTLYRMSRYDVESIDYNQDLAILKPHKAKSAMSQNELCTEEIRSGVEVFLFDHDRRIKRGHLTQKVKVDTDWASGIDAWASDIGTVPGDSGSPVFTVSGCALGLVVARDNKTLKAYIVGL